MAEKVSLETGFRDSLEDVITLLQKLAPHCTSVEETIEMLTLAKTNDSQLRILLNLVQSGRR